MQNGLLLAIAISSGLCGGAAASLLAPEPDRGRGNADLEERLARLSLAAEELRESRGLLEREARDLLVAPASVETEAGYAPEEIAAAVARHRIENATLAEASHAVDEADDYDVQADVQKIVANFRGGFDSVERELLFQELRDAGRMDDVVAAFEEMAAADPENGQLQVALGVVYLEALFGNGASPETGRLATLADQAFDRALEIDPEDWSARFTKAVSLANWPASLGKSGEAVQHFKILIEQQERSQASPEHAMSYLFLGNLYESIGEREKALDAWEEGLARFPDATELLAQLELLED